MVVVVVRPIADTSIGEGPASCAASGEGPASATLVEREGSAQAAGPGEVTSTVAGVAMATATCGISPPSRAISLPSRAISPAQMIVEGTVGMSTAEISTVGISAAEGGQGAANSAWNGAGG